MKQNSISFKAVCLQSLLMCVFLGITLPGLAQPEVGEVLPGWTKGTLDIHHINTGKGESALFILPDGTTMLVDAGATRRPKPRVTDAKPNDSRTPGEWISRYILHFIGDQSEKKLDYVLLTHFHGDHMGEIFPGAKTSKKGPFKLTGITEVAEYISFGKLVDRGWPMYNWPRESGAEGMRNYIEFAKWGVENDGMIVEQFNVGVNDQFVLLNQQDLYPDFEVRNIAANGHVWTGTGNNERNHFPLLENLETSAYPGENKLCCAFRLSYGKFDYFNGGDITTGAPGSWEDIETPVGLVTGPVEVCEANHHAYYDAMGTIFLQAVRPRVHIIQSWSPSHPSPSVLTRMTSSRIYPGPRDVFSTNVMEETHTVIGSRIDQMKSRQGHIVIRVAPGGNSYTIYILDDSEENFKVTSVHGPYACN
jgi:beta-lactamase superfamily II metal-dependent hydrolase